MCHQCSLFDKTDYEIDTLSYGIDSTYKDFEKQYVVQIQQIHNELLEMLILHQWETHSARIFLVQVLINLLIHFFQEFMPR